MAEKLKQGDRIPKIELKLLDGETLILPDNAASRYTALLFYCGYCQRQLAAWEQAKPEL